MREVRTTDDESSRFVEVDAALRPLNIATSVAVAGTGAILVTEYGVGFGAFSALPLVYWLVRSSPAGRLLTLRRWNISMIAMLCIAIGGSAFCSGGADSTYAYFAGIIGLLGHAMFAHLRRFAGLGVAVIAALALLDLALGRTIDLAIMAGAIVLTGYLPYFVDRMLHVEQMQRRRAVVDQLTGCLNRHALDARSIEIEEQGARTDSGVSVIMFDLDHFKTINDVHGHAGGDRVLEHVAYLARKELRRFELMYRLGGEEFAVLLPGMGLAMATRIAETIRATLEQSETDHLAVTASFGVAYLDAPFAVADVFEMADRRMYEAKRTGRNRVVSTDTPALLAALA